MSNSVAISRSAVQTAESNSQFSPEARSSRTSFGESVRRAGMQQATPTEKPTINVSKELLESQLRDWNNLERRTAALLERLPDGSRDLMRMQLMSQQLLLRTEFSVRAAETVSGALRRLQQANG